MQEDCRKNWKPGAAMGKEDCSPDQDTDVELKYILLLFFPPLYFTK